MKFSRYGKIYNVFSRKGVIVSAGAIGTPKLLMLSGIGPKNHLIELKVKIQTHKFAVVFKTSLSVLIYFQIKTIIDLPVGQYLQDHLITGLDLVTVNNDETLSIDKILNPASLVEYYFFGKGTY